MGCIPVVDETERPVKKDDRLRFPMPDSTATRPGKNDLSGEAAESVQQAPDSDGSGQKRSELVAEEKPDAFRYPSELSIQGTFFLPLIQEALLWPKNATLTSFWRSFIATMRSWSKNFTR
jgi:hypothetical protein